MDTIKGRAWVFDDNVDTDQILPGYAMAEAAETLGRFAMAGSKIADFSSRAQKGDIIVAGKNFGCGSSREQAPVALKLAGVSLVIAPSFARIFRRNAINIGLPVMQGDLRQDIQTGDLIAVDIASGEILSADKRLSGQPLPPNVLATVRAGGLINRVRQELGITD